MAGGAGPRRKGTNFERAMVHLFTDNGIEAKRIPLSGASPFDGFSGFDLHVTLFETKYNAECKHIGKGFKTLYKWLAHGKNHFLIVRADRSEPLAVIPVKLLMEMVKATTLKKEPK